MTNTIHDIGVARQIGTYSDAVEAPANARWLVTAGTPGLAIDGKLPADITGQAELAWTHILEMLERADMSVHDLVKVTQYLVRPADIPKGAYPRSRRRPTRFPSAGRARIGAARISSGDRGLRRESVKSQP